MRGNGQYLATIAKESKVIFFGQKNSKGCKNICQALFTVLVDNKINLVVKKQCSVI